MKPKVDDLKVDTTLLIFFSITDNMGIYHLKRGKVGAWIYDVRTSVVGWEGNRDADGDAGVAVRRLHISIYRASVQAYKHACMK